MASTRIQRKFNKNSGINQTEGSSQPSDVPSEIQCKICKKRYDDPKLLPCLHTFCKPCLEKSFEKHGALYCPSCPGEISSSVEFTGVDDLPSNFLVSSLLQVIDLKHGANSKQCESCDEQATATSRCFECSDFLCESCVEAHRRVRFTKQHRVVSVKNLNAESLLRTPCCSTHTQQPVKMFCKQCKQLVCRSCIVHQHNNHVLTSLNDAAENSKPKLNTLLVATRARIPILQRKLKEVHSSKERLEGKVDDVIKGIQATSARILMAVKRREKDLYRMLRRIHDKKSGELESRETDLQNELAQVLDSCEFTEELVKQESDVTVLSVAEMAYARLQVLGEREIASIPEVHDNEIEYNVDDKAILDELKIYGKITSREEKAKKSEERSRRRARDSSVTRQERKEPGNEENAPKKDEVKSDSQEDGKGRVERRPSWLETLANPRALLRRLSFGGDESDGKRSGDNTAGIVASKDDSTDGTKEAKQNEAKGKETNPNEAKPSEVTFSETKTGKRKSSETKPKETKEEEPTTNETKSPEQKNTTEKSERERIQGIYDITTLSEHDKTRPGPRDETRPGPRDETRPGPRDETRPGPRDETRPGPSSSQETTHNPSSATSHSETLQRSDNRTNEPAMIKTNPGGTSNKSELQPSSKLPSYHGYEPLTFQSILKDIPPTESTRGQPAGPLSPNSSQTWTVVGGSTPSGAHSLSYLPTLNILTKNRRGRPREVEIQLESPDNSIVSAQILDHKNGTYTIFYCPLTPGEHNLYVNVVGKNIKHGKRVLNFYGKFGSMGTEELFLTRRALSCIQWQVTPGFVEVTGKKLRANPDI